MATLLLAVLNLVFSPLVAGKAFLLPLAAGWCVVGWKFFGRYFQEAVDAAMAWLLLICLVGFTSFFWYGFVSYPLGALLFPTSLARYRTSTSFFEIALMGAVFLFSRAMLFIQFGMFVPRAILITGFLARHLIALVPSALLSVWFLAGRFAGRIDPGSAAAE